MRVRAAVLAGAAIALAAPLSAGGATQQPAATVKAEGSPFTGDLAFDPPKVTVKVGQIVRWTNTSPSGIPHTATEDHGLWNLGGSECFGSACGFASGQSRQRVFEAGTQHYYCQVHPTEMRGVVRVPVRVAVRTLMNGDKRIVMRWASKAPAAGEAFDVQIRKGSGGWKSFRKATTAISGGKTVHPSGALWSVRARLRKKSDASRATGWSPVAKVHA